MNKTNSCKQIITASPPTTKKRNCPIPKSEDKHELVQSDYDKAMLEIEKRKSQKARIASIFINRKRNTDKSLDLSSYAAAIKSINVQLDAALQARHNIVVQQKVEKQLEKQKDADRNEAASLSLIYNLLKMGLSFSNIPGFAEALRIKGCEKAVAAIDGLYLPDKTAKDRSDRIAEYLLAKLREKIDGAESVCNRKNRQQCVGRNEVYFGPTSVDMRKFIFITTDGDKTMTGAKKDGFHAKVLEYYAEKYPTMRPPQFFHYMIHQEQLCAKAFNSTMQNAMDTVIKIARYIRDNPHRHHAFKQFRMDEEEDDVVKVFADVEDTENTEDVVEDVEEEVKAAQPPARPNRVIPTSIKIRWLTIGNVCEDLYKRKDKIAQLLRAITGPNNPRNHLRSVAFLNHLAFAAGILRALNNLSAALMGKDKSVFHNYRALLRFVEWLKKANVALDSLANNPLKTPAARLRNYFPECMHRLEKMKEADIQLYSETVANLIEAFNEHFADFSALDNEMRLLDYLISTKRHSN